MSITLEGALYGLFPFISAEGELDLILLDRLRSLLQLKCFLRDLRELGVTIFEFCVGKKENKMLRSRNFFIFIVQ